MSVMNVLGVTLMGPEFHEEFLGMVGECLKLNSAETGCEYIDAYASPSNSDQFMLVSIWSSEEALMTWYRSPFHIDLRKRGMQGLLKSYFSHQAEMLNDKTHSWTRPSN